MTPNAPDNITIEFLRSSGEPVRLADLGSEFLAANRISPSTTALPFRVAVEKKKSKAGNAFYDYSQNGVPLPDGLATFIRVEGAIVPMGRTRPSQSGYPTREGSSQVIVGGIPYSVTAYLTEGKSPFYVKMIAHKTPQSTNGTPKSLLAPRGGQIIV